VSITQEQRSEYVCRLAEVTKAEAAVRKAQQALVKRQEALDNFADDLAKVLFPNAYARTLSLEDEALTLAAKVTEATTTGSRGHWRGRATSAKARAETSRWVVREQVHEAMLGGEKKP
jgi:hypothetical protein